MFQKCCSCIQALKASFGCVTKLVWDSLWSWDFFSQFFLIQINPYWLQYYILLKIVYHPFKDLNDSNFHVCILFHINTGMPRLNRQQRRAHNDFKPYIDEDPPGFVMQNSPGKGKLFLHYHSSNYKYCMNIELVCAKGLFRWLRSVSRAYRIHDRLHVF